jgi:polysaccharide biosynthesis protein PslG
MAYEDQDLPRADRNPYRRPVLTRAMAGRAGWGAIAVTLVALTAAIALAQPASAAAPRSFVGVAPQTTLGPDDYARMQEGKVGTLRVLLNWPSVDPSQASGDYTWGGFDGIVAEAARHKIRVLPFLYGSPTWVAQLDNRKCGRDCGAFAPRHKQALRAWQTFVGDAVARYGRGGEFWAEHPDVPRRQIRAWQIWNEQNSKSFYRPKPSPRRYAKLLRRARKAIRSEDGGADVVLGGMAELSGSRKAITGSTYLRRLYRRDGVKRDFDGVAPHPYGARMKAIREQITLFRKEMKRARDRSGDLWVTEIGWGSAKGGHPLNRGKQGQATRVKQAYRYFLSKRKRFNVKSVVWFSWMDSPTSICDWCATSGLFKSGLRPKPAWRAYTKLSGGH